MKASAAVWKPHSWTTTPTIWDLRDVLGFSTPEIMGLGLFLILCLGIRLILNRRRRQHSVHGDMTMVVFGFALLLLIPLLWLVSLRGTSYFVDRYLTGTIIGVSLLACAAIDRLVPPQLPVRAKWPLRIVALALFGGTAYSALFYLPDHFVLPPHSYTQKMANALPDNIPIVVERGDIFAEAVYSQPELKLRYLLDWDVVNLAESPRGDVSGYHEMNNWRRSGYYADSIAPSQQFLDTKSEFLVISDPKEQWFVRRVKDNPAFAVERIGQIIRENDTETVWHVHRLH